MQYAPIPVRVNQSRPSRPFVTAIPPPADTRAVVGYRLFAEIDGTALAVSQATLRLKNRSQSQCYLSLAGVPSIDLSALLGGEVALTLREYLIDGSYRDLDFLRFYLDSVETQESHNSYSVSIGGWRQVEYGNLATYTIANVITQSESNQDKRWRIPMRSDLKPGDTLIFEGASIAISELAYFLNPDNGYIEVSNG